MDVREATMRDRLPGELLMHKVLVDHSARPPRSALARFFGISPLRSEDWPWYQGALGERVVAQTLSKLPAGWHVFHSLPIGTDDSDIDHVVVGPPGVFTINTKHHAGKVIWVGGGTFMVGGQRQPYIRNAEYEGTRLTRLLRARFAWAPEVRPVIAVVNSKSITVKTAPRLVHIDGGRTLTRWLLKQRAAFNAETVEQIAAFLDDPQTWRQTDPQDRNWLSASFGALSADCTRAATIQTAWKFVGVAALVIAVIWILTTIV
jgi:hypothetical protein